MIDLKLTSMLQPREMERKSRILKFTRDEMCDYVALKIGILKLGSQRVGRLLALVASAFCRSCFGCMRIGALVLALNCL